MSESEYAFGRPPKLEPTFGQLKGQPAIQAKESLSGHISLFLSGENWDSFKSELITLVIECFPEYEFTTQSLEQMFTKTFSNDLIVLLQNKENMNLVGFSVAHINIHKPDVANIELTGVAKEARGHKLVGELLSRLEEELKQRGVKFLTRGSRINDGYADAIERHYGERVIEKRDSVDGRSNPIRRFKIQL